MNTQVRHISTFLHQWAPPSTKLDYDNVGLLVGDPEQSVTKTLTCLDVTPAVVEEAIETGCELIVAHHPLIFQKISRINPTDEQGKIIYRLIQNNISLIAAHTNLDAALDGVSFVLAQQLGLDNLKFLDKSYNISRKIVLTTSYSDSESVLKMLNYHSGEEAHFYNVEGRKDGQRTFEAIIDEHNVSGLIKELRRNGLLDQGNYQVMDVASPSDNVGMGVLGFYHDKGLTQDEFLERVSTNLNVPALRYSGSAERIKKVAVCGGAGVSLTGKAIAEGAQAFVTADIKYHDYFTDTNDFLLVDVGHYESEVPVVHALQKELSEAFEELSVYATDVVTNPMNVFIPNQKQNPQD
ncbi:Nif3-like dinuclear metal center hexameric protein [Aliifodinibius sp. S!AR15-10]|uniref:Nif3-like dinuclear metal center hexameric protein n=1 Tax=Aliifodinibius sp. S!AR15-10 TaxID=2950437 RepID=UPI002860B437|nr:Nif3-like dinuclear metal center hexameric protein [Aliifodinibius sp. S!AR15-10]MDR8393470.1 Nif3-like dinuclear metal center hexameric protein [Aliifodinibius sp. S!AR15-10]